MKKLALLLVFCFAIMLFGCGEKNNEEDLSKDEIVLTEEEENPEKGGFVTIYSFKPDSLCPLVSTNKANIQMLNIVYDGLFSVDKNMNINPQLANSWTSFDNNKRFVVDLNQNVLFHNGEEFTAKDVLYSVKVIKENPQSAYAYNLQWVTEVKELGKYQVEFNLIKPLSRFPALLDFPVIKSQDTPLDAENYVPVGTGGFIFENRNEGNLYHLVKNDKWWGGEVYLDSVKVKLLPDKDSAMYAFSLGEISLCPAEKEDWGKFMDAKTSDYMTYSYGNYNFLGYNHENPALSCPEVREAIASVLDRDLMMKNVFMDFCEAAFSPVKSNWLTTSGVDSKKKDWNKARDTLEESKWKLGNSVYSNKEKELSLKFEILINEESYIKEQFAKKIAEDLTSFGIYSEVKKVPYDEYVESINSGNFEMFMGSVNISPELDYSFMFADGNIFKINDEDLYNAQYNLQLSADPEDYNMKFETFCKLLEKKNAFYGLGFEEEILLYNKDIKGKLMPTKMDVYHNVEKTYLKK